MTSQQFACRLLIRRTSVSPVVSLFGFALLLAAHQMLQASRTVPPPAAAPVAPAVTLSSATGALPSSARLSAAPNPPSERSAPNVSDVHPPPPAPAPSISAFAIRKPIGFAWKDPRWMVRGELKKAGAGILFFAYSGSQRTLRHVVLRAERAGRTFREHNPGISLAIVTNNASVDFGIFDARIAPRDDLIFAGEGDEGAEDLPTQTLTRIYYLAHSPYELTWALDSNAVSCVPFAAQAFLSSALVNRLWGFRIAHPSQDLLSDITIPGGSLNMVYLWTEETSALLRDWLLLQLRQGVASDDRHTLYMAELRLKERTQGKFRIGKLAPELSASFFPIEPEGEPANGTTRPAEARITSVLRGAVSVIHSTQPITCDVINSNASLERQLLARQLASSNSLGGSVLEYASLTTYTDCAATLATDAKYCLLSKPRPALDSATVEMAINDTSVRNGSAMNASVRRLPSPPSPPAAAMPVSLDLSQSFIVAAKTHRLEEYARSGRCAMCTAADDWASPYPRMLPNSAISRLRYTPCRVFVGARLGEVEAAPKYGGDRMTCRPGSLLRWIKLATLCAPHGRRTQPRVRWPRTTEPCLRVAACSSAGRMRFVYECSQRAASGVRMPMWSRMDKCNTTGGRGSSMERLVDLDISCPTGYALAELNLNPGLISQGGSLNFERACSPVLGQGPLAAQSHYLESTTTTTKLSSRAGGHSIGAVPGLRTPPSFDSETLCSKLAGETYEALEQHVIACGPRHVLASLRLTAEDCVPAGHMHFKFTCVGVAEGGPT